MFKYTNDVSNEAMDVFALEHGEAHAVEFPKGVTVGRTTYWSGLASSHEEARYHASMGFGKLAGYIRISDFWPDFEAR